MSFLMKSLSEIVLRRRIRNWTLFFIAALIASGLSAIPLKPEMNYLVQTFAQQDQPDAVASWLLRVQAGVNDVSTRWPFLALGTDWLAFGHIVIGLGFIGLLRDPVRNEWLITWGLLACAARFSVGMGLRRGARHPVGLAAGRLLVRFPGDDSAARNPQLRE